MSKEWTDARIKTFIISVLRAGTRRWPPKWNVKHAAATEKKVNESTGRLAQHYLCAKCKKDYPSSEVEVDHIKPVVNYKDGWTNWDDYITSLFCLEDNLQVLCLDCHKKKTLKENKKR